MSAMQPTPTMNDNLGRMKLLKEWIVPEDDQPPPSELLMVSHDLEFLMEMARIRALLTDACHDVLWHGDLTETGCIYFQAGPKFRYAIRID